MWVNRDGREEPLSDYPPAVYARPRVSPDGTRVAVDVSEGDGIDIWVYDLSPPTRTLLTFDFTRAFAPLWTQDGQRVGFWSEQEEPGLYYVFICG